MSTEVIVHEPQPQQLTSYVPQDPEEALVFATKVANMMDRVVRAQGLYSRIGDKDYLKVEGWQVMGGFYNLSCRELYVEEMSDGSYKAIVELFEVHSGRQLSVGSAICGMDEIWGKRPAFARRSMAITRACGKAYRMSNKSWIPSLKGYACTAEEEMPEEMKQAKPIKAKAEKRNLVAEVKEVTKPVEKVYDGNPEMAELIKTSLIARKVPEEFWAAIDSNMMGKPGYKLPDVINTVRGLAQ